MILLYPISDSAIKVEMVFVKNSGIVVAVAINVVAEIEFFYKYCQNFKIKMFKMTYLQHPIKLYVKNFDLKKL